MMMKNNFKIKLFKINKHKYQNTFGKYLSIFEFFGLL